MFHGTFDPIIPDARKAKIDKPVDAERASGSDLSDRGGGLFVCFSHLRWDFVWQRPQHLLSRAAASFRVVVFEEPVFAGRDAPRLALSNRPCGIEIAVPQLAEGLSAAEVVAAQRALVESFLVQAGGRERTFWYYTPMAVAFSGHLDRDLTVYDNMDELSSFRGASPEMLALEQQLLAQTDVVFTGGLSLFEAKRNCHPNVHPFPSSIDTAHFAGARHRRAAAEIGAQPSRSPRLGFFGVIDERLDVELLAGAADLRPDWQFTMVGPVVKIDPATLPQRSNIHWAGPCAYADLPDRLAGWDIGMMPFALNEATRFISPTKTPEFLAAGMPVVSTPIVDVVRSYGQNGLVEIAATAADFVAAAGRLLARPKAPWLAAVDRHLAAGSWDQTWSDMHRLMRQSRSDQPLSVSPERRLSKRPPRSAPAHPDAGARSLDLVACAEPTVNV